MDGRVKKGKQTEERGALVLLFGDGGVSTQCSGKIG